MRLTDYRVLLIECDGVLIDHHGGIWSHLNLLQQNLPHKMRERTPTLTQYEAHLEALTPVLPDLGFSACHCFAYQQLMQAQGITVNWKESLHFARSIVDWPQYEDAFGALRYLHKFYKIIVRCDREIEDLPPLCDKLSLRREEVLIRDADPQRLKQQLSERGIDEATLLVITNPRLAATFTMKNILIINKANNDPLPFPQTDSLAQFVREHQMTLRQFGTDYA